MGILFATLSMVIFTPALFFVILCMTNIIFADALIASLCAMLYAGISLHMHPAGIIMTGVIVMSGVTYLYLKEKGFMVLSALSALSWGYITGFIAGQAGAGYLFCGLAAVSAGLVSWLLHMNAGYGIGRRGC